MNSLDPVVLFLKNYMVVDHVQRLPEKLPLLYAGLTR